MIGNRNRLCLAVGAGAIGRTMTGEIFTGLGFDVVYVEANPDAVRALNRDGWYAIRDDEARPEAVRRIGPVRAILPGDPEAAHLARCAEFICTAIGADALRGFTATLGGWLRGRDLTADPPVVLLFENGHGCETLVREALADRLGEGATRVAVRQASIERMSRLIVKPDGRADAVAEPFMPAIVDQKAREESAIFGDDTRFALVDSLDRYYARKLYANNLGHAAAAYMGIPLGYATIVEALSDGAVRAFVSKVLCTSGQMLSRRYGFSGAEMDAHIEDLLNRRYANRLMDDALPRLARDPERKLGREERLVGCALECLRCGVDPDPIIQLICLALNHPGGDGRSTVARAGGVERALRDICCLNECEPLYRRVLFTYDPTRV